MPRAHHLINFHPHRYSQIGHILEMWIIDDLQLLDLRIAQCSYKTLIHPPAR